VQLKFASLGAMVSRHVAPIAARRDLGGSAGNFKLSRISAATILKLPNVNGQRVIPVGTRNLVRPILPVEIVPSRPTWIRAALIKQGDRS
jgi:hypothetical protein